MRGFQIAKKVVVSLNHNLIIKWLAILYLFICIAFHLTSPTTALYTHEEKISGVMSVNDQQEETDESNDTVPADQDEEIDRESDLDNNEAKSVEIEEQKDKIEDMEEAGDPENKVDHDAATQSEKGEPIKSEPGDQQTDISNNADVSSEEEGKEQVP